MRPRGADLFVDTVLDERTGRLAGASPGQGTADAGISLRAMIQEQRLEACRRELRDPRDADQAIAAIGRRWGFVDPSHCGRAFRQTSGVTPTEWRRSARSHD
ncbi:hypothetical protein Acsp06_51020 [Actinomycetospora sp. NBRC 106375]|uniref:helix-turn-helix domain-containing protein n=1 Tax=Actinomycetospora sp. NBRC 106375 TaxID=3032207 RepID=UPI0024A3AC5D|nr:helix-turn-helix domain-containing protein [Actinomycetospora sp. NBRC 106375]GLZ48917.1 hypothetical protein Acsp06_51020 [Actinomycetospora sp. NBRC 106375]